MLFADQQHKLVGKNRPLNQRPGPEGSAKNAEAQKEDERREVKPNSTVTNHAFSLAYDVSLLERTRGRRLAFLGWQRDQSPHGAIVGNEIPLRHPLNILRRHLPDRGKVIVNGSPAEGDLVTRQQHGLRKDGILAVDKS